MPPIGIATPLSLDESNGTFVRMRYSLPDQIADNLRNLILTNHGERVGVYDFGANLRPLTLELEQPIWEEEAMRRIIAAVSKYMPFVRLGTFEMARGESVGFGVGRVAIRLTYTVDGVQTTPRALEINMYVVG